MKTHSDLKIKIRKCTQDDYDWCYELSKGNMKPYVEKYWNKWNPKLFTSNFKVERVNIVELDKKPIGFYEIEFRAELGIIHGIQICESYRNKGIGTKIMAHIEDEFRNKGIKTSRLRVFVDNPAVRLYQRFGYVVIEEADYYTKLGTIVMAKQLF